MDQKTMVHLCNGIVRGRKIGTPTLCDSMDGTGEHYAKWNKPDSEGQIPYDLTFTGTSSTKEKNKENITRDIEINDLTVTSGEVGGDSGGKDFQELL